MVDGETRVAVSDNFYFQRIDTSLTLNRKS